MSIWDDAGGDDAHMSWVRRCATPSLPSRSPAAGTSTTARLTRQT